MTEHAPTRRSFLRDVGSLGLAGVVPKVGEGVEFKHESIDAEALVSAAQVVPPAFDSSEPTEGTPLMRHLTSADQAFAQAERAVQRHHTPPDYPGPQRVLSTAAIITDEPVAREVIESAVDAFSAEFRADCAAESNDAIACETSQSRAGRVTDWRLDLVASGRTAETAVQSRPVLADVFRLQYFGRVTLWTDAYGPVGGAYAPDRMVDRYARLQRSQLHSQRRDAD